MPSPFPGMDPYLEHPAHWPEFHHRFIDELATAVNGTLPPGYRARIDERSRMIDLSEGPSSRVVPDVAVDRNRTPGTEMEPLGSSATAVADADEPVPVPLPAARTETEGYVEIIHLPDRELVTVIELLSPSNKVGDGRVEYLAKRGAIRLRPVHLVEIDLLVGGPRLPMDRPLPPGDHYVIVSRAETRPMAEVYAWSVRRRFPVIRLPLRRPDPDLRLDLGAVFAETYRRARYEDVLDYTVAPTAPLAEADRTWAARLSAGR